MGLREEEMLEEVGIENLCLWKKSEAKESSCGGGLIIERSEGTRAMADN